MYSPWGNCSLLIGGRKTESMVEGRVLRYAMEDCGGDPSEGTMQVT